MKIHFKILSLVLILSSISGCSQAPSYIQRVPALALREQPLPSKEQLKVVRAKPDRAMGVVQLTGKDIVVGQTKFPNRTPADPVVFENTKTNEVHVYGTQVDGTGFSYLKYKNKNDLLRGAAPELVTREVYLPNGQKMEGKEAIWDTYRLSHRIMSRIFSKKVMNDFYAKNMIKKDSDLFFGGIALQETGELGRWTEDNWRRRVHPIAEINGKLQILNTPVFNPIKTGSKEGDYKGFGLLSFLPGDYIGHAYGPNFKIVKNKDKLELWIISEEITRRVEAPLPAEVTEIMARKMVDPITAAKDSVLMVSVNDDDGLPHPDSDRGPEMSHTKLIEGFRPTSQTAEGIRISKKAVLVNDEVVYKTDLTQMNKEYFFMTGSPGNFAGDSYDSIVAVREGHPIGTYKMIKQKGSNSWKRLLKDIKSAYRLSWAGRGTFVKDSSQDWWLLFHAVDKDLKPDGSYGGVIPPNTEEYHRNLYAVPIEFFINLDGEPDVRIVI